MDQLQRKRRFFVPLLWVVLYLFLIDVAVNFFFAYPEDPRDISPTTLQQYFEFGRSTEGKLAGMTRPTDEASAPVVSSGWLVTRDDPVVSRGRDGTNAPVVTIYGMSHARNLAYDMAKCDSVMVIRYRGAPGAVVTWSLTAYALDRARFHSDVVVLAVMTEGVAYLFTTSGATMPFDRCYPYTYPRYYLKEGKLDVVLPPFLSVQGYREYFYNPSKWDQYVDWLSTHDKYYDPLLFRETAFDQSSIFRMLRRSYTNAFRRTKGSEVYNESKGFNVNSDEVKLLSAAVLEFVRSARSENSLPILYLVNNLNTGDRLLKLLKPILTENKILYLSSDTICPPDDPRVYDHDAHFIPSKDIELASEMIRIIHSGLIQNSSMVSPQTN